MTDLSKLSLEELKDLQKSIGVAIKNYDSCKRSAALAAIDATAREHGYTLQDLVGGKAARKPVAPKYAHPENKSETWSGSGRRPRWVQAALDAGKSLADLVIPT